MNKYSRNQDNGMGWTVRIFLAILGFLILSAVGLGLYASTINPTHQTYRVVIPNSRFPN